MNTAPVVKREKLLSYSAFLSILVVLIHTCNVDLYGVTAEGSAFTKFVWNLQQFISGNIAKIGVPSFFMFSGLLFYRDFDFSKYPKKMKNRFFSLIIPYFIWNLFRFVLFYALGKFGPEGSVFAQSRILFTLPNLLQGVFLYKYNLGYWFMYQLILYTLLCPVLYILLKKKSVALLTLCALFIVFCTDVLGDITIRVFQKKFIQIDGLFYYMLGAYVGMHHFDIVNKNATSTRYLAIFGVLLGQLFFFLFHKTYILFFYIAFCTVSAISFWYLFDICGRKPLPASITTITFFIYSGHGTILELFQQLHLHIFPHNAVTALAEYVCLPVITLGILVLASILLKRFMPKLWKLVNGGR